MIKIQAIPLLVSYIYTLTIGYILKDLKGLKIYSNTNLYYIDRYSYPIMLDKLKLYCVIKCSQINSILIKLKPDFYYWIVIPRYLYTVNRYGTYT